MSLILYFLVMAAAMIGLSKILPGFQVAGWVPAIFASLVLAAVNTIVKPILFVITLPFTILTLGLFLLVINALLFWAVATLLPGFNVGGFGAAFIGALLYSVIAWLLSMLIPDCK